MYRTVHTYIIHSTLALSVKLLDTTQATTTVVTNQNASHFDYNCYIYVL